MTCEKFILKTYNNEVIVQRQGYESEIFIYKSDKIAKEQANLLVEKFWEEIEKIEGKRDLKMAGWHTIVKI